MRNSGALPRKVRIVTTEDTAASTMEPTVVALQSASTSSITKRTPVIGVLNAAAIPAAAPTGAINRIVLRSRENKRPNRDAMPAPICRDGSSGPSELPIPMDMAQDKNFPTIVLDGTYPFEV